MPGFPRTKTLLKSLVLATAVLLYGCDSPDLGSLPSDGTILAFGDSLTVGVGTAPENSYPNVLADLTGMTVIGSGVSGETTTQGAVRIAGE